MEQRRRRRRGSRRHLRLPELPWDVWVNILSRLPMKSILQGRSVCKAWSDLLSHPHFTKVHSQRSEQCPGALVFHGSGREDFCLYTDVVINGDGSGGIDTPNPTSTAAVMKLKGYDKLIPAATCNGVVCFSPAPLTCGGSEYLVGNPLVDQVQDLVRVQQEPGWHDKEFGGFGFSLETKRYKIVAFHFPWRHVLADDDQDLADNIHVQICTMGHRGEGEHTWRNHGLFPRGVPSTYVGSYLDGGIHWLVLDGRSHLAFICRLDLDSDQFERLPTPESEDFQPPPHTSTWSICHPYALMGMKLGVSGGHLILCANLKEDCPLADDTVSIWVRMKESWMKEFVVKTPDLNQLQIRDVKVLNYSRLVEDAAGRHKAADGVVLFYPNWRSILSSTNHVWGIPFYGLKDCLDVIPLVPSLLSFRTLVG